MGKDSKDFFWPSYVDLLTALFTIVLVLFILSFKLFKDKTDELKIEKDKLQVFASQYERIKKIDDQIKSLESSGTFVYDSVNKRFLVKKFIGQEIFIPQTATIDTKFYPDALSAGKEILNLVENLYAKHKVKLLIIIEGNTARKYDGTTFTEDKSGYSISYNRALALKSFWLANGITFDPLKSELLIAGSGFSGIARDENENNNKRFLIQIIPKIEK